MHTQILKKKKKKKSIGAGFDDLMVADFSFSMCLRFQLSKSSEGMDGGLFLSLYRKVFFFFFLKYCRPFYFILTGYFSFLYWENETIKPCVNIMKQYNLSLFNCEHGRILDGHFSTWQHLLNCRKRLLLLYIVYDIYIYIYIYIYWLVKRGKGKRKSL